MECCRLLVEAGADSTITSPEGGYSASDIASENGHTEVSEPVSSLFVNSEANVLMN